LHDSLDLIQEAGNGKLQRVGMHSTLELNFVTYILKSTILVST